MSSVPNWVIWLGSFVLAVIVLYSLMRLRNRSRLDETQADAIATTLDDDRTVRTRLETSPLASRVMPPG